MSLDQETNREEADSLEAIAIIGMAGRFPGASSVDEFWENLKAGRETISHFSEDELDPMGVELDQARGNPRYVRAKGILRDPDLFDAAFFGILPKDAELMDPQHRVFLEICWEALERAGYDPDKYPGAVGVYAGCYIDTYLLANLCSNRAFLHNLIQSIQVGSLQTELGNDKDYLATRVSFKLNLRGPSLTLQTACSTSLVAISQACQSLLSYGCDMALAGGVTITFPQHKGYFYQEDGMLSPDGHCRTFDARAQGTVFGNGAGVIVLKRLSDALADGDSIYAVIKGAAINNDGGTKFSYTAPSVDGQAEVIALAQAVAGVNPETISYVEAHGTGTPLGDPIEIAGLTKAFRAGTDASGFCAIGSLKTNIGHLDVASGVAAVIKTSLALKNQLLPPTLHFEKPNPKIDFPNSPFYVVTKPTKWEANGALRRAGVSSFGVGGTNAHVVLEEAPATVSSAETRPQQLLVLSAKTASALDAATDNLAAHLRAHPELRLSDVAYTLQIGRKAFNHRRVVVCSDTAEAAEALQTRDRRRVTSDALRRKEPSVTFMFPGQGAQQPGMAADLYRHEPVFREHVDHCCELLKPHLGLDLRDILYPAPEQAEEAAKRLTQTVLAQPAIFVVEYALAQLWMHWGVRPNAMIGHSVGEFVAACLAGVISVEDALPLLATRGRLMQQLPGGAMLSVRMPEAELRPLIGPRLNLAAINGPALCVVAGPTDAAEELMAQLEARGVVSRKLHTSHGFHSWMMDPVVEPFEAEIRKAHLSAPQIPIFSTVTGDWLTEAEATDAGYWARHLRQTVRFSDAIQALREDPDRILLEVGPGTTLTTLAKQHPDPSGKQLVLSSLGHAEQKGPDLEYLMAALGRLWMVGLAIDWSRFYEAECRHRVALPTYPFERKRFWVEPSPMNTVAALAPGEPRIAAPALEHDQQINITNITEQEKAMASATAASAKRLEGITARLKTVLSELSGMGTEELEGAATLLELGFDSLLLTQVSKELFDAFGVRVTMRQLIDEISTIDAMVAHLNNVLPPDPVEEVVVSEPAPAPVVVAAPQPVAAQPAVAVVSPTPQPIAAPAMPVVRAVSPVTPVYAPAADASALERLMAQQLQVMTHQLELLRGGAPALPAPQAEPAPLPQPAPAPIAAAPAPAPLNGKPTPIVPAGSNGTHSNGHSNGAHSNGTASNGTPAGGNVTAFSGFKPADKSLGVLTASQQRHLDDLMARYMRRTQKSKQHTERYRSFHADPRTVSGFNRLWKEMCYPIVVERSKGSRLWDLDGNEYIDLLNGFGPGFLGHSPDFVVEAIKEQADRGFEIGPQTPLAGEVAELISEMTGMERVSFMNTGSEAVQAAMRLARTVTGRDKIVLFSGDYHGNFDEVLVRGVKASGQAKSFPAAPGIPRRAVEDVLVLDYGSDEALEIIRQNADQIAAVLVEPIQSRKPELQPHAFIRELRRITEQRGIVLVFDEVITGFRTGPGGAQDYYGIRADLATYGKVLAGGMPIGVVAGKSEFMDTFDGGMWQYGDASFPEKPVTFFAGTFIRHPLTLASARATLKYLKASGPALWERIRGNAARLTETLDAFFVENNVPFRYPHFGSQMYLRLQDDQKYANLLYYHLRSRGIYILEGFPSYMTIAHSEADIDYAIQSFKESVWEMQDAGFFPTKPDGGGEPRSRALPAPMPTAVPLALAVSQPATVPVTAAQQEIWLACQMGDDASCAYNEATTLQLRGSLDVNALRKALQEVVSRHDALRATFSADGKTLNVPPALSIELPVQDISALDGGAREARIDELKAREGIEPFNLTTGPLIRAALVKMADDYHVLFLTAHHIVCDGWSFNVVLEELSKLYGAYCQGKRPELAAAPQFAHYARWQQQFEKSAEGRATEDYWLQTYADSIPMVDLPTDSPRQPVKNYDGATERRTIGPELYQKVKRTGARNSCTLYATLLAAFETLLHRITGQDDLAIGIPAAGQTLEGQGSLIGHCVNFLPLHSRVSPTASFREHLLATKKRLLDAHEHQNYTYGRLIPQLDLRREPGRMPLIEVEFNVERVDYYEEFHGLDTFFDPSPKRFANFDIFLNIMESSSGLVLDCDYSSELFTPETIQRWLAGLERLLEGIVENPEQQLSELPLLTEDDRQQVLVEWNATQVDYPRDTCVHDLIRQQAARTPDAIAVSIEGRQLSYRELDEKSNQLAHYLREAGVGPETLVGLCLEPSLELPVGLLGILKAGGAYVPIDPGYPAERIAFVLQDAEAPLLLTQEHLLADLPVHAGRTLCLDRDWPLIAPHSTAAPESGITPENLAYVIYTSGSTGQPKGVEIPHQALTNFLWSMKDTPGMAPGETLLAVTTISFDIAGLELYLPLVVGGRVWLVSREVAADGSQLFEQLANSNATVMQATPATWRLLLEAGWQGNRRLKILCGGEALPRELASQLVPRSAAVWNMYGPTETTIWSTTGLVEADAGVIHIGRPIANTQIYLLDAHLQPVPVGVPGELYIGGDGLARGYHHRPELTAERFIASPLSAGERLYRTGDLARWRADGTIECLGRVDHQVKIRGFRIELGEIEGALRQHATVTDCVVLAREDTPGDRRLVAYLVMAAGAASTVIDWRGHLSDRLPGYMIPSAFVCLPALPLTPNGKVDRKALPGPDAERRVERLIVAPRTQQEQTLAEIWKQTLHLPQLGVDDDIFDLGGDSLLVFQIVTRAREAGFQITPKQVFQLRTVAKLAEACGGKAESNGHHTFSHGTSAATSNGTIPRVSRDAFRIARPE